MAYNRETKLYEGFIYVIQNDVNDCLYIGRTYRTIKQRWKEHLDYAKDHKNYLYQAMRVYGIEHFYINVIEMFEALEKETIKTLSYDKERVWISYYKSKGYTLYNMTEGGDDLLENKFPPSPVIQYDLFCNELARFNSISEASDQTGVHHSDISTCCSKEGKIFCADNYIWRYENDPLTINEIQVLKNRYRGVAQYDFNGTLLNIFYRPRDAMNYINSHGGKIVDSNISSCMKGKIKSAGGYIWRYKDDPFNLYPLPTTIRRVEQRSKHGELINIYNNCADASRYTGVNKTSINSCCLQINKQAGGYIWCYEGDFFDTDIKEKEHPVDRYDLSGNYIDSYSSIEIAADVLDINRNSISSVCNDRHKTAGGYIWRFHNTSIDTYKYKLVN